MGGLITAFIVAVPVTLLLAVLVLLRSREKRTFRLRDDDRAFLNRSLAIDRVVSRYRLGDRSFEEMVPDMTFSLVLYQRDGSPLAAAILSDYADGLYDTVWDSLGRPSKGEELYSLLAPDGRITSTSDQKQPAVPLFTGLEPVQVFDWFSWEERGKLHPHIHLAAAAFALAELRSAKEAEPEGVRKTLDRAWFLLAFALNTHLHNAKMFSSDRRLILGLIDCCARLHKLSGDADVPSFVHDAIENKLKIRRYRTEWVTDHQETGPDGRTVNIGDFVTLETNDFLRVGKLLRERFEPPAP